ncbi:MAG: hypothetical protein WCE90_00235 [Candidatus Zixiibacteriota bacterium]
MFEVGAVIKVLGELAAAYGSVEISRKAYDWVVHRARDDAEVAEAKQVLGIRQGDHVAYRHDSVHPLFPNHNALHPDNMAGLVAAAGGECWKALLINKLFPVDTLTTTLDTNLVLIGSPTAEGLSRPIFGYEPADDDRDSLVLASPTFDLPYRWVLDKRLTEEACAKRMLSGGQIVERPNWRIEGNGRLFIPATDSEGMLAADYLLVTRLRNFLTPDALNTDKYLVSFGGTHGTATRALEILLKDRSTLRKIASLLKDKPASFQMLLRVCDIRHDINTGTKAHAVELVGKPIILPDDYAHWRAATKIAEENVRKWVASTQEEKHA